MPSSLRVPSGIKVTLKGLYRQLASLSTKDIDYIFSASHAKKFRQPVGDLLGQAFANLYSRRREEVTGRRVDFWKLHKGKFRDKFVEAAVNARIHGLDPELFIDNALKLSNVRGFGAFPAPSLVCGPYVFSEVLGGWTPSDSESAPPDEAEDVGTVDQGESSWVWQPGYRWNNAVKAFVRE